MSDNGNTIYEDKEIFCFDCKDDFTWSGGEQRFYAEREFTPPKRCKPCRAERKASQSAY